MSGAGTVREAAFEVLRAEGLTTLFANPGSTEVPLLTGLPPDLRFVLALHESAVVGLATGYALAAGRPALALLHTTAGLGNAVAALATARVNRAPLVVLVGQQDRRHLALEPFLTGRLAGLAGDYPVWTAQPARPQDLPSALARARHEAATRRGPALVVAPMDDWSAPYDGAREVLAAPALLQRPGGVPTDAELAPLLAFLTDARSPALVVGAGADSPDAWEALVRLAESLECPVWQEAFGARAGFPQDHPRFAGVLPATRSGQRDRLTGHDAVLAVGTPVFRHYGYEPGPLVEPGTHLAILTDDPDEAHRAPVRLAVLAAPAPTCARLADALTRRPASTEPTAPRPPVRPADPPDPSDSSDPPGPPAEPPRPDQPLSPEQVLAALAARLPRQAVVVEETPSSRPALHRLLPAREPLGFLSAAMGGLGFALPAAAGLRMARADRPVVAVVGDGSALYGVQALWSAARYRCGVLYLVLSNGRYAVLDRLAEAHGQGAPPWPAFEEVSVYGMARALGCPARRITGYRDLVATLDEVVPRLDSMREPLLLDVAVAPEEEFHP